MPQRQRTRGGAEGALHSLIADPPLGGEDRVGRRGQRGRGFKRSAGRPVVRAARLGVEICHRWRSGPGKQRSGATTLTTDIATFGRLPASRATGAANRRRPPASLPVVGLLMADG
jgi:hypothetical protein